MGEIVRSVVKTKIVKTYKKLDNHRKLSNL